MTAEQKATDIALNAVKEAMARPAPKYACDGGSESCIAMADKLARTEAALRWTLSELEDYGFPYYVIPGLSANCRRCMATGKAARDITHTESCPYRKAMQLSHPEGIKP